MQVNAGFVRLLGMNRPEWHWGILGTASSAGLGIMFPAFALALSNIIGVFYDPDYTKMKHTIRNWCIVFAGVGGLSLVCATLQQFCFTLMGQKLAKRLRLMLMQALLRQVKPRQRSAIMCLWIVTAQYSVSISGNFNGFQASVPTSTLFTQEHRCSHNVSICPLHQIATLRLQIVQIALSRQHECLSLPSVPCIKVLLWLYCLSVIHLS